MNSIGPLTDSNFTADGLLEGSRSRQQRISFCAFEGADFKNDGGNRSSSVFSGRCRD